MHACVCVRAHARECTPSLEGEHYLCTGDFCTCPIYKTPQVVSGVPLVIGIRAACAEIQTHKSRACDKGNSVEVGLL